MTKTFLCWGSNSELAALFLSNLRISWSIRFSDVCWSGMLRRYQRFNWLQITLKPSTPCILFCQQDIGRSLVTGNSCLPASPAEKKNRVSGVLENCKAKIARQVFPKICLVKILFVLSRRNALKRRICFSKWIDKWFQSSSILFWFSS